MEEIKKQEDEEGFVSLVKRQESLNPGDRVIIREGVLEGLEAIFLEELSDGERVAILLDAITGYRVILERGSISPMR